MKYPNCLLISLPTQGFLCLLFLFAFSFFCVHLVKLALLGAESLQKTTSEPSEPPKPPERKEEKTAPTPQAQEPVYYIVEKKTRRPKSSYSEPKQINFK